jgi:folate-binding Fe-S cluster repair protein YgfZ
VLELEGTELPAYDADVLLGEKAVGRVTSAAREDGHVVALGYVRREVPDDAELRVEGRVAALVG